MIGPAGKKTGGSQVAVCPAAHSISGGGKSGCVSLGLHTAPTVAVTVPVPPLVNVTPTGTVGLLQLVKIGNCMLGGKTDRPVPLPVTTFVTTIWAVGVFDEHDQLLVTVTVCVTFVMVIGPAAENAGGLQVMVP